MRALWVIPVVLALAGCANASIRSPDLPGCDQTEDFTFAGETTLASLGLREFAGGQESIRTGMIWVTAGPVSMGEPPMGAGGVPGAAPLSRMVCVQWPDGSGMAGSIPDDWRPPVGLVPSTLAADGFPPLLGLALVVGVVLAVSFVAFRQERPA
ncbi:MAG: hypothetical protein ABIW50_00745 [Candidatus Limnocylindria bacterium]